MRILIIEDNRGIAKALKYNLKQFYSVDIVFTGNQGLTVAQTTDYDAILLDLQLPGVSGQEICHQLRDLGFKMPIIIISGLSDITDKIELFSMGADDYMTKPFNIEELRARIDVAIRHSKQGSSTGIIRIDDLVLDPASRVAKRGKALLKIRRKEFDLLEYLMRNSGQTLTRSMITDHIWDMNENLWTNSVDVHIKNLRDKVDKPFGTNSIRTVHGLGYVIDNPDDLISDRKKKGGPP